MTPSHERREVKVDALDEFEVLGSKGRPPGTSAFDGLWLYWAGVEHHRGV